IYFISFIPFITSLGIFVWRSPLYLKELQNYLNHLKLKMLKTEKVSLAKSYSAILATSALTGASTGAAIVAGAFSCVLSVVGSVPGTVGDGLIGALTGLAAGSIAVGADVIKRSWSKDNLFSSGYASQHNWSSVYNGAMDYPTNWQNFAPQIVPSGYGASGVSTTGADYPGSWQNTNYQAQS
ncbi:unnamed protein product, partial [Didymodactylos carnosus]